MSLVFCDQFQVSHRKCEWNEAILMSLTLHFQRIMLWDKTSQLEKTTGSKSSSRRVGELLKCSNVSLKVSVSGFRIKEVNAL